MREEITRVLGEAAQYDRELRRGAERFSIEHVKEIKIRLVSPSGVGIKYYHRGKQTTKKEQKEKEKVKEYVLVRN